MEKSHIAWESPLVSFPVSVDFYVLPLAPHHFSSLSINKVLLPSPGQAGPAQLCNSNLDRNCIFCPDLDLRKAHHTGKYLPINQYGFILFIFPFVFGMKNIRLYSLLNLPPTIPRIQPLRVPTTSLRLFPTPTSIPMPISTSSDHLPFPSLPYGTKISR